jgi:prophage regulatory protein
MDGSTLPGNSGNVFVDLGISEPDVDLAKADLAIRIQRLAEHRRLTSHEAASLLQVPESELRALFQGRLATCSLDQLIRVLTWLGDDVEIVIRPRLQRRKRGGLRVLQAAAVEKPEDFQPVRRADGRRTPVTAAAAARPGSSSAEQGIESIAPTDMPNDDRQLLDKHAVEKMTSLDITTIYRKMVAGTFPQPVRVGRRRVAWRTSDIIQWQQRLEVGTDTVRWRADKSRGGDPGAGGGGRRGRA